MNKSNNQKISFKLFVTAFAIVTSVYFIAPSISFADNPLDSGSTICSPDNNQVGSGKNLSNCINNIYTISVAVAATISVIMLVIAGYLYMTGGDSVKKAKEYISAVVAALLILFGTYALLNTINPDLTNINGVILPDVQCDTAHPCGSLIAQSGGGNGNGSGGGSTCTDGDSVTAEEVQLAKQIQAKGSISLANSHVSTISDTATASQNINDIASGNCAARSSYTNSGQTGPGGNVVLGSDMLGGILSMAQTLGNISISEIAGGTHSSQDSKHYQGEAFDVNVVNGVHLTGNAPVNVISQTIQACRAGGGTPNDETASANHVHCQW